MADFSTKSEVCPIHIDFHKSIKCPKLTTSSAYRACKLTIRVLGIYNGRKGILHTFCWNELDGCKGPAEIISCLNRLINEFNDFDGCRWLKIWSDNTTSEVKNNLFCWYLDNLERQRTFERIDLNFLEPGHGYSINDRLFGVIEKHIKRYTENLPLPEDWFRVIQDASPEGKINVIRMFREHFLDYETYFKNLYVKRFQSITNEPFLYGNIAWINFGIGEKMRYGKITTCSHTGQVWLRTQNDGVCEPIVVDYCKKKQKRALSDTLLEIKNKTIRKPKNPKAVTHDLVQLAACSMSENEQRYYENLRTEYLEVFGYNDSENDDCLESVE